VDFEALRAGLAGAIPFNTHLGLVLTEVAPGRGIVKLPDRPELHNHVGTQHAGGLFAAGEFASGAAFLGSFAEQLARVTPLARAAEIDYRKLARGEITATARLDEPVAGLVEELEKDGKVEFEIEVDLTDADARVVAAMKIEWHVRLNA
jgi:acyl-coenzyme A thioesterase PaaI-like protein